MGKIFRFLCFIFVTMSVGVVNAQTSNYVIAGEVGRHYENAYAFLHIRERGVTLKTKIASSMFNFKIKKVPKFEIAVLYFSPDSTLKFSELQSLRRPGIVDQVDI